MEKWQREIVELLKEQFQGEELEKGIDLLTLVVGMEPPHDDYAETLASMMKAVSKELPPLASTYAGFMLGVAWEQLRRG